MADNSSEVDARKHSNKFDTDSRTSGEMDMNSKASDKNALNSDPMMKKPKNGVRYTEEELLAMPREERLKAVRSGFFERNDPTIAAGTGQDSDKADENRQNEKEKAKPKQMTGFLEEPSGNDSKQSYNSHMTLQDQDFKDSENMSSVDRAERRKIQSSEGKRKIFPDSPSKVFKEKNAVSFIINIVVIVLIIFSATTSITSILVYQKHNIRLVDSLCDHVVESLQSEVENSNDFSALNELTSDYIESYAQIQNIQFFLCNSAGNCVVCTENYQGDIDKISLSGTQQKSVKSKRSFNKSMAGIVSSNSGITRGRQFSVKVRDLEEDYYLLAVYSDKNFRTFYKVVISVTLATLVFCLAAIIASILIEHKRYRCYFGGYSKVVQNFAKDDFSVKLNVPSYTKSDYFTEMIEATNKLAENIETSETRRKQFISNVSHELRTPMTSICGFVDGMLDGTIPKSEHRKYLTIVSQETRRLKNMIQSMLNLTRIESGTLRLPKAEFNLTDVAVRTLLLFENAINQKSVEVECNAENSYIINGNEDYIQQVIYNIIENAVKFVDEGGKITLSVVIDPVDDHYIDISVKNTGEGLSSDEIPHIFERFYKTDKSRSKDKTGLGLGLTICKRIVHLHDGRILVRSVKGEFTEFIIQLPYSKKSRNFNA